MPMKDCRGVVFRISMSQNGSLVLTTNEILKDTYNLKSESLKPQTPKQWQDPSPKPFPEALVGSQKGRFQHRGKPDIRGAKKTQKL